MILISGHGVFGVLKVRLRCTLREPNPVDPKSCGAIIHPAMIPTINIIEDDAPPVPTVVVGEPSAPCECFGLEIADHACYYCDNTKGRRFSLSSCPFPLL